MSSQAETGLVPHWQKGLTVSEFDSWFEKQQIYFILSHFC